MSDPQQSDLLVVPNIGTRVFRRPGPRIRSAKTGEIVPPEKFATALVTVAVLEHAVAEGKTKRRPGKVLCHDCKTVVKVPTFGPVPKKCRPCAGAVVVTCACGAKRFKGGKRCFACVAADHKAKATCAKCGALRSTRGGVKWGRCWPCFNADRAAAPSPKACADCEVPLGFRRRQSAYCRSCASKRREAARTPEQKAETAAKISAARKKRAA